MTTTQCLCWAEFQGGSAPILFNGNITDGANTEITSFIGANSIGVFENSVLTGLQIQVGDGSILSAVNLIDSSGGTQVSWAGCERATSGCSPKWNLLAKGLMIPISKGMTLKLTTTD